MQNNARSLNLEGDYMADYSFYFNTKFVCGRGSLGYLNELDSSRTALAIDSRALAADRLEEIKKRLTGSGRVCEVVADVSAEPSTDAVQKVLEHIRAFKPDCILAIGGGSVLDTAKALWVFYEPRQNSPDQHGKYRHADRHYQRIHKRFEEKRTCRGTRERLLPVTQSGISWQCAWNLKSLHRMNNECLLDHHCERNYHHVE
jgi:hypothetical protein